MSDDLGDLIARLRTRAPRVVVIGDVILDRWLRGGVHRLSREAPVPVVEVGEPDDCAGGAANTAANLAALGASVQLLTVVGDDAEGRRLRHLLQEEGVDVSGVIVGSGDTASKTRIVADEQIMVRVDRGGREPLPRRDREHLREALSLIDPDDVLVVCDYDGGIFDETMIAALSRHRHPGTVIVDAHDLARWAPVRPDIVTPNHRETAALLGRPLPEGPARVAAVERAASEILSAAGCVSAVVTLDCEGTVAIERGGSTSRTHARPMPERQATGAGDTFAAALSVATALDAPLARAARFAQRAADLVVARPGTAICTLDELEAALADARHGDPRAPTTQDALREALAAERARGRTIVFTNGCFDVLHLGHTVHLQQAKELGDVLVVALNDDASVHRLKGPGRPVNPVEDRARVLQALGSVDHVVVFSEDSPVRLLEDLQPQIYAKGGDYTAEMLDETPVVRAYGGDVRILEFIPAHSTTEIVNRIAQGAPLR